MRSINKKIDICRRCGEAEGAELGEAIISLCDAAHTLHGLNCAHETDLVMITVDKLCRDHCRWAYEMSESHPEFSKDIPKDVWEYFTKDLWI